MADNVAPEKQSAELSLYGLTKEQVVAKDILELLSGMPLPNAQLTLDITKAWLPAQCYVQLTPTGG